MRKKAQSTTEYAVLLAVVAAAIIGIQIYTKRGVQGRIRDLAGQLSGDHYESEQTTSRFTTQQVGRSIQAYTDGTSFSEIPESWTDDSGVDRQGEEIRRWGNETVVPEEE